MVAEMSIASSRERWRMFPALAAAASLTILDVSTVGIALPAIQDSMGGQPAVIQLMLVCYTLAYAATLVPAGRIGDVLPRRTVFLTGLLLFLVGCAGSALSPAAGWLVAARCLEGVGAGVLMPQVLGLIQASFPASERPRPLAYLAAATSATSLLGPVIAGGILGLAGSPDGWRTLFAVTAVAAAAVTPIALVAVPKTPTRRMGGFDGAGAALLGAGVVLAIAPLSSISQSFALAPWMPMTTAAGVALLVAFAAVERRRRRAGAEPLIDPDLFRLPHLGAGVVVSGCMHAAATAGTLIVTIGLQQFADLTPLGTALWMLPSAAASLSGSWIASRFGASSGRYVLAGTLLGAVGLLSSGAAFATVDGQRLAPLLAGLLFVTAFGSGLAAPSNQARALREIPEHRSSVAGSLIQFAQRVGSAIGMAVALAVYYALFDARTVAGVDALGPSAALGVVACFLLAASAIAAVDARRARA